MYAAKLDADLSNKFWAEAVLAANYLQNRLITSASNKIPFEVFTRVEIFI